MREREGDREREREKRRQTVRRRIDSMTMCFSWLGVCAIGEMLCLPIVLT